MERFSTRAFRDERGVIAIFVALALTMFFGAAAMAVDLGMLATARSEAQRAADAAALAGAAAMAYGPGARDEARTTAMSFAARNPVRGVSIQLGATDIWFTGDTIHVRVLRTAERGNAVPTVFARMLGRDRVDISTGPARVACLLPIAIPDRWVNRRSRRFDPREGDYYEPLFRRDGTYNPQYVGYASAGERLQIRSQRRPRQFRRGRARLEPARSFLWLPDGVRGRRAIRERTVGCPDGNASGLSAGEWLAWHDANARDVGDALREILIDPRYAGQYYDPSCTCVRDANDGDRIVTGGARFRVMPFFDPAAVRPSSRNENLRVTHFAGVWVERVTGRRNNPQITVRILPTVAEAGGAADAGPLVRVLRLVQ